MEKRSEEKLGRYSYVLGGLSYIPLFGVLFGIFSIAWGLVSRKRGGLALALIGLGGIAFSGILYGGLFYFGFVQRGGVFDELRTRMAKSNLTSLVQSIEFYKLQNGRYPEGLEVLAKSVPKEQPVFIHDPSIEMAGKKSPYFHYQLTENGNAYYLLGVGPDGKPFTADDILPEIDTTKSGSIGFRKVTGKAGASPDLDNMRQEAAKAFQQLKAMQERQVADGAVPARQDKQRPMSDLWGRW